MLPQRARIPNAPTRYKPFAGYGGKALQKLIQRVIIFQVFKHGFNGNPGSPEDGAASQNIRINRDDIGGAHATS
jgi:hypothetical protein